MKPIALDDVAEYIQRLEPFQLVGDQVNAVWWGENQGTRRYVIGSRFIIPPLFVFDTAANLWVGSRGRWYSGPVRVYNDLVRAAVREYLELPPYEIRVVAREGYTGLVRKRMTGK